MIEDHQLQNVNYKSKQLNEKYW